MHTGIIIVLILVTIYFTHWVRSRSIENSNLRGFWSADSEFCHEAELSMFMLYIGDGSASCKNAYFLAKNNQGVILNDMAYLTLSGVCLSPTICERNYGMAIEWADPDTEATETLPNQMTMSYRPLENRIILHNDDMVYAVLYKDNSLSSFENSLTAEE